MQFPSPMLIELSRTAGKPVTQTFTGIAQAEHRVSIANGSPGINNLRFEVNGKRFEVEGLAPGERREIDVASAMRPGSGNTIELTAKGKPGGDATILLHD